MKCIHCSYEIENSDNFCPKCGHFTAHGYSFLENKDNRLKIKNGATNKQKRKLSTLVSLFSIFVILFAIMVLIQGNDLFKPIFYLKKQIYYTRNGYYPSLIVNDNKYNNVKVLNYKDSIDLIKKDFNEQKWQCNRDLNISKLENELEDNYKIPSVTFCDLSYDEILKIKNVIDKMYTLFPNISNSLTNITITNIDEKSIAYFQPKYQFINVGSSIKELNKVNKTQILLNSYYFLNNDKYSNNILDTVGSNWYVKDVTWESTIAHEFGHYVSFSILLKKYNLDNITFENINNEQIINELINDFNNGSNSKDILIEALNNYNKKYEKIDLIEFASIISNYASDINSNGDVIYDEVIAEAVHDFYLHGTNMENSSKEIIDVLNKRLDV